MVEVTAPISSFSSSGPSVEWCVPICCTILIVLPEEVVKLRNSGRVGLLASTPIAETIIMETRMSISNTLNVMQLGGVYNLQLTRWDKRSCIRTNITCVR